PKPGRRLFLPLGTPAQAAEKVRSDGWVTLAGLEVAADARAEARRLACTHVWQDGSIVAIE
ncbi:MAG TPA: ATP phosphoribosyltransferase regulatory subunit, partial [Alphaproteobacteria bacterium]